MNYDIRKVGSHPDHWYPLAWSDEIAPGKVIGRQFAGQPIALFRTRDGVLAALEDRCAHRQVPLHLGVVAGQTLKCGYHGWAYDQGGTCIDVPYLGSCRLPNGVKSYPVREASGMVLVYPGNPAHAEARWPAHLGRAADPRYRTRRLNREVACHYSFLHENLFDMNHQFLHRKNMGSIKARCLARRGGESWCEVDYTFSRTEGRQSMGEAAILSAMRPGDGTKFRDLMTIRTDYPYQHLRVWVGDTQGDPALDVWLCYTPLDADQRRNRTFGFLSIKKARLGLTTLAWPFIAWFTERIFQEDKVIVEAEQRAHDAQGADCNHEVFPAILDLRTLLVRCGLPPLPQAQPSGTSLARSAQT